MINPEKVLSKKIIYTSYLRLLKILKNGKASTNRINNVHKCYEYLISYLTPPYEKTAFAIDNLSREMKSFSNVFKDIGSNQSNSYSYSHTKTSVYDPETNQFNVVEKEKKNDGPVKTKKYKEKIPRTNLLLKY